MNKKLYFIALVVVVLVIGVSVAYAAGSHRPPVFSISDSLDSGHNTLTVTAGGPSGYFQQQGANCEGAYDPAETWITAPYEMSQSSMTIGGITETVTTGEITQTDAGQAGQACVSFGGQGSFTTTQNIDVSSLSNGTYTLSVTMCGFSSSVCRTVTDSVTINRPSESPLSGSCSGSPSNPLVGTQVTWSAGASGGNGSYSYSWSGAASGSGQSVTATYSTTGIKTANVTISSGSQSITKSCSVEVSSTEQDLCAIEVTSNMDTTWLIGNPTGSWGKSDGYPSATSYSLTTQNENGGEFNLAGNYTIQAQDLEGFTKTITPSSTQYCDPSGGAQTKSYQITYTCIDDNNNGICDSDEGSPPPPGPDPAPECSPASQSAYTNNTVSFSATGGDGSFSWSAPGSSNTSGTGSDFSTSYSITGGKTVTVTSAGQSDTCSVSVSQPSEFYCTPKNQTVEVGEAAYVSGCGSPNNLKVRLAAPNGDPSSTEGGFFTQCWGDYFTFSSISAQENVYAYRGSYNNDTCYVEVTEPAPVNDASCIDITAPPEVIAGETFQASVTMENTGTKDWDKITTPHRLGVNGNNVWGLNRVNMPVSLVEPGQQVTFNFTATAPGTTGNQAFNWRMLEETVEWFGTACTDTINVISGATVNVNSNLATTWDLSGPSGVNSQINPAISVSYDPVVPGTYTLSNVPEKEGYKRPTISPASSQSVSDGGTITFNINYECLDVDDDGICDSVSGPPGAGCTPGDPGCGVDNCPTDYNPGQEDQDLDGVGDVCDDCPAGDCDVDPNADYFITASDNLTIDKSAGETQSNNTTINVIPESGYSADVNLSISSGPAVEYVFADETLDSSEYSTGTTLYVVIDPDFPQGNYPIVIEGASEGITRTATIILSVDDSGQEFEEF